MIMSLPISGLHPIAAWKLKLLVNRETGGQTHHNLGASTGPGGRQGGHGTIRILGSRLGSSMNTGIGCASSEVT